MKITKSQLKKIIKEELEGQLPLPGMAAYVRDADPNNAMLSLFQYVDNLIDQNPDADPEDFYGTMYFYEKMFKPTAEILVRDMIGSIASAKARQNIEEVLRDAIVDFSKMDSAQRKDYILKQGNV
jgi:hypothetical protein